MYFGWARRALLFGSELKALRRHPHFQASLDRDSLALFVRYCCVPAPWSIFKGINKILPGTIITVGEPGETPRAETYWSATAVAQRGVENPYGKSAEEAVEEFGAMLTD